VGHHEFSFGNIRICQEHRSNNGGCRNFVGPELEHNIECNNLKGNKKSFECKVVDTSTKAEGWINKAIRKANLSFIIPVSSSK
jgi:hypothetical protein